MKTHIKIKKPWNLTPPEYRNLVRLTMRQNGNMAADLFYVRRGHALFNVIDAYSIAIYRSEDNLLLGHCLLDRRSYKNVKSTSPCAQFYVRADFRRQGIGRRLTYHAQKIAKEKNWPQIAVIAWSDVSTSFFEKTMSTQKIRMN